MTAYYRVDGLVTCGLTACTLGSTPGPILGNEYISPHTRTHGDDVKCCGMCSSVVIHVAGSSDIGSIS